MTRTRHTQIFVAVPKDARSQERSHQNNTNDIPISDKELLAEKRTEGLRRRTGCQAD